MLLVHFRLIRVLQIIMNKSYEELLSIPTFEGRFDYLKIGGNVGEATFGSHRYLNQILYKMPEWRDARRKVIVRDGAFDLAHPDYEMGEKQPIYVHHINPITIDDILERKPVVLDLNNLIVCSFNTHQAIHYGDESMLPITYLNERRPGDQVLW